MKLKYTVTVGNIGTIRCDTLVEACDVFRDYKRQIKDGVGRAESPVVLWRDDEIMREWHDPKAVEP